MKKTRFKIEYKDSISMRGVQIVEAENEKRAIMNFQLGLMSQDDYMSELIYVEEVPKDEVYVYPSWSLEDGTELDQDSQDVLNEAMSTYTNSEGITLEQAMERASQNKNK